MLRNLRKGTNQHIVGSRGSLVAQWVKDPVLPLLWLRSQLWCRVDSWPICCWHEPKKKSMINFFLIKKEKKRLAAFSQILEN